MGDVPRGLERTSSNQLWLTPFGDEATLSGVWKQ